jgi:transcriptional regulator of aromatic amino acid metabolism
MAGQYKVGTIRRRLSAISQAHRVSNFPSPAVSPEVRAVMQGIIRTHTVAPERAKPTMREEITDIAYFLPEDLAGIRDRALILMGFAGALRRRVGHVERAHNGALFLDEVESMPLAVQVKMLRVLEEREVHPIGANEPRALDLRVLASSKVDLGEAARAGTFREDLYYRLNVVRLRVPPLRERREDIPLLFAHFLRRAADRHGIEPPAIGDGVRRRLLEADWPGNIRELAHFAERVALSLEETARPVD